MNISRKDTREHKATINGLKEREKLGAITLIVNGKIITRRTYNGKFHRKGIIQDWNTGYDLKGKEIQYVIHPFIRL